MIGKADAHVIRHRGPAQRGRCGVRGDRVAGSIAAKAPGKIDAQRIRRATGSQSAGARASVVTPLLPLSLTTMLLWPVLFVLVIVPSVWVLLAEPPAP